MACANVASVFEILENENCKKCKNLKNAPNCLKIYRNVTWHVHNSKWPPLLRKQQNFKMLPT